MLLAKVTRVLGDAASWAFFGRNFLQRDLNEAAARRTLRVHAPWA